MRPQPATPRVRKVHAATVHLQRLGVIDELLLGNAKLEVESDRNSKTVDAARAKEARDEAFCAKHVEQRANARGRGLPPLERRRSAVRVIRAHGIGRKHEEKVGGHVKRAAMKVARRLAELIELPHENQGSCTVGGVHRSSEYRGAKIGKKRARMSSRAMHDNCAIRGRGTSPMHWHAKRCAADQGGEAILRRCCVRQKCPSVFLRRKE